MRKLFRFKYEPCNGTCYAWCDILPEELNKFSETARKLIVTAMVEAHGKLCDNPDYSFGVDLDEKYRMFVAHFRTPTYTHTYISPNLDECVYQVCAAVIQAEIPQVSGACNFGEHGSEDLGRDILKACTDSVYRKEHHENCPCTKKA